MSSVESSGQAQKSGSELRKRHANLQDRVQGLWNTASLFKKGIDHFDGKSNMYGINTVTLNTVGPCYVVPSQAVYRIYSIRSQGFYLLKLIYRPGF